MKTWQRTLSFISSLTLLISSQGFSEELFKLDNKATERKHLTPAEQQNLFEVELQNYERMKSSLEQLAVGAYLKAEAQKQKKTVKDIESKLLEVAEPTEKDLKDWYEQNKSRIPYPMEQIKAEISKYLKGERIQLKRNALLEDLKNKHGLKVTLKKPESPDIQVKDGGFQTKGTASPQITIYEFADYQCPHCKAAHSALKGLVEKHKDKVKFVYIDYPINPSGISTIIAEGSHCAAKQNKSKYWEYHDLAFERQSTLDKDSPIKLAKDLKLVEKDFEQCMKEGKGKELVEKGKAEGERVGVSGTPFVIINNKRYMGGHSQEDFAKEINGLLHKKG